MKIFIAEQERFGVLVLFLIRNEIINTLLLTGAPQTGSLNMPLQSVKDAKIRKHRLFDLT